MPSYNNSRLLDRFAALYKSVTTLKHARLLGIALTLVFGLLVSLLIAVGYIGIRGMERGHKEAHWIIVRQWVDVQLADRALDYSNRNTRINMQVLGATSDSEIRALIAQRNENSAQISEVLRQLRSRIDSDEERASFDAVVQARQDYTQSYRQATDLVLQHKNSEGREWMIKQTSPLLMKYHNAWSGFVRFQTEEMNQKIAETDTSYSDTRKQTIRLIAISILLSLAVGLFAVPKIMIEILHRHEAESNLLRLNHGLEEKIRLRTADIARSNQELSNEIAERTRVETSLRSKTAFLEAQINSTIDGILVVDRNGKRLVQNVPFLTMFGIPDELAHQDSDEALLDFVSHTIIDRDRFLEQVKYLYEHEEETSTDEIRLKSGKIIDRYSAPVRGADGTYYGRIWYFRDITERKRRDEQVRLLSAAVEQSPVAVVITDLRGDMVYVNNRFVECTGYTKEEALGQNPRILKSGNTAPEDYKRLWATITRGEEWRGEFQNRKKDGSLYRESAVIRPIRDEKGEIFRFVAMKEDISDRHTMEEQLRRSQKLESIGQLAAGIAHEINTPMQFIGDNTRFIQQSWMTWAPIVEVLCEIREGKTGDDVHGKILERLAAIDTDELTYLQGEVPRAIEQSLGGVERVSKIVQAMKRFSHPGSVERQPIDINQCIETTITVARNEWKYVSDVETDLSSDVGLVPCYGGEFNQVVLNLLVNAAQAIAPVVEKNAKGKITIRTRRDDGWAEISVQDTGCGIPISVQPRIFDPFFTTKEVGKGTGQGLALAHAVIVKKHGGKLWFETEVGKGTTFFIRLPIDPECHTAQSSSLSAAAHFGSI